MQVTCNESAIVFTDDKNKSVSLELFEQMPDAESVKAVGKELNAQGSASKGAVSLMTNILNSPALDGYKGVTEWAAPTPVELKQAMRRAEDEYIKPLFFSQHGNPSPSAGVHETQLTAEQKKERTKYTHVSGMLDLYMTQLRAGGSYAVARGFVLEYFAKAGQRPIAENGRMLSVAALKKILELKRKEHAAPKEDTGIAGKLVSLSAELNDRTEKTNVGELFTAIAALKSMLAVYEKIELDVSEARTQVPIIAPSVASTAAAVIGTAQRVKGKKEESALM
jgi:hypothetical protein